MVTMIKELNLLNIIVRAYTSTESNVLVLCARLVKLHFTQPSYSAKSFLSDWNWKGLQSL